ncbi:cytochrome D1 domain-containing protein [Pseudomonas aeruginosa]
MTKPRPGWPSASDKRLIQGGNSIGGASARTAHWSHPTTEPGGVKVFDSRTLELVAEIPATRLPARQEPWWSACIDARAPLRVQPVQRRDLDRRLQPAAPPHLTRHDIGKQPYDAPHQPRRGATTRPGCSARTAWPSSTFWAARSAAPGARTRRLRPRPTQAAGATRCRTWRADHRQRPAPFVPATAITRCWCSTRATGSRPTSSPASCVGHTGLDERQIWVNFGRTDNDKVQVIDSETHEGSKPRALAPRTAHGIQGRGDQVRISVR